MASKQSNVDFIVEQLAQADDVTARKMFGEYAIYTRGKLVALFCDDQLFVKPTDAGRAFVHRVTEAPPYPGAKPYFLISGDRCEDGDWLSELIRITARALPTPKPKGVKKAAKATTRKASKAPRKANQAPRKVAKATTRKASKAPRKVTKTPARKTTKTPARKATQPSR